MSVLTFSVSSACTTMPWALVRQQQMLVLVHHRQPRLEQRQEHILLRGLVKELVVDVQLQHVALLQALVPLGAAAVDLHPLDADVLLRQRRRQQGQRLAQKPVQPLPRRRFFRWSAPA